MPNTFITPSMIARVGLATLYDNLVLAQLVWRDFDSDFAGQVGDTVNVRVPAVFAANPFSRAAGITIQTATESSVPVKIDTVADVSFNVTSEELALDVDSFAERLLNPAMMAIVQAVDVALANGLAAAATGGGGGGTKTWTSPKVYENITDARTQLTRNKLPLTDRFCVLSPEATGLALKQDLFVQAQQAGSTTALREADLGRAAGFDTFESGTLGYGPGQHGQTDGLAFQRNSLAFVVRPLMQPLGVAPNMFAIENYKGLSLRVVQSYDIVHKQDIISVDFFYGLKSLRPSGVVALDFGQGS